MSEIEQEEVCTCVLILTRAQHSHPHSLTENGVHKSTEGKIQSQKGEYLE